MKTICLLALVALTGCSSYPTCGTRAAEEAQKCTQSFGSMLSEANAMSPPQRNYITDPYTGPAKQQPQQQPAQNSSIAPSDQYQMVLVNTPQGYVYKRCKVLNGQVVACL